jgi:hypothetical protein
MAKKEESETETVNTSADPFSTFLGGVATTGAGTSAVGGAPAEAIVGTGVVAVLKALLKDRAASPAQKKLSDDIGPGSVACLFYLADGQKHSVGEAEKSLTMSDQEVRDAVHSLEENELVEIPDTRAPDTFQLTEKGRDMIVRIGSVAS